MPSLKRYADSAAQRGSYVLANVGGDTPVTLQVSGLADRLFGLLDYHPPDTIPSKLVWSMYDVGLLFTFNSLEASEGGKESNGSSAILKQLDLDNSLTTAQKEEILTKLKEFDGPETSEVEQLINRLKGTHDHESSGNSYGKMGSLSLLQRWAADESEFQRIKQSVDGFESYASASIQTFSRHPYLSAPPVWIQSNGSIKYQLNKEGLTNDVYIYDHRHLKNHDFKIVLERSNGGREIAKLSRHGNIIDYENNAGRIGSRINMTGLTEWVIPDDQILVNVPSSSDLYISNEITEYEGEELEVINKPTMVNSDKIVTGVVDRISNSENPVVELGSGTLILDQGEQGEKYVIEQLSSQRGRVLSRFVE